MGGGLLEFYCVFPFCRISLAQKNENTFQKDSNQPHTEFLLLSNDFSIVSFTN